MALHLSRRTAIASLSPTAGMRQAAAQLGAAGHRILDLAAGEPDFATPDVVVEAAARAARDPALHRYAPTAGLPALREAVAHHRDKTYGHRTDPARIVVTCGAKQAVFNTLFALLDPGDEVLITAPHWSSYPAMIRMMGAVPVAVPTTAESGFKATVADLESARTPRTKAVVFVNPANPTGIVHTEDEMRQLGHWVAGAGLWVVSDEIYGQLVYGDTGSRSLPAVVPEVADQCVVVDGVSKTYAMTGWRVGWLTGPPAVVRAVMAIQSHSTSHPTAVAQHAAVTALTEAHEDAARMRDAFARRRVRVIESLADLKHLTLVEPRGAFYAFPRVEEPGTSSAVDTADLATRLLRERHVATMPGDAFAAPGHLRISYAAADSDIEEGISRLRGFLSDLLP